MDTLRTRLRKIIVIELSKEDCFDEFEDFLDDVMEEINRHINDRLKIE